MAGVALFHGGRPGVPGGHLLFFDFSFEVSDRGSRVAGEALPLRSFFCQGVCPFISSDIHVAWDPVDMSLESPGG